MRRKPEFYLWKIQEMCGFLLQCAESRTEAEYLSDLALRLAVERAFILIGEAMAQMRIHFPDVSAGLEAHVQAIGFRNVLVHRYWDVDDQYVWAVVTGNVQPLKLAVDQLLAQHPPTA